MICKNRYINKILSIFLKSSLILVFFNSNHYFLKAGIQKSDLEKWQKISNHFFIDTVDFAINKELINLWIREKNYKKRRLTVDCENFIEKEIFENKVFGWNRIKKNSDKFKIVNQLCFLTNVPGYTEEPKRKQPNWARKIITLSKSKNSGIENLNKTNDKKLSKEKNKNDKSISKTNKIKNYKVLTDNSKDKKIFIQRLFNRKEKVKKLTKDKNINKKNIDKNEIKSNLNVLTDKSNDEKLFMQNLFNKKELEKIIEKDINTFFNDLNNIEQTKKLKFLENENDKSIVPPNNRQISNEIKLKKKLNFSD